MDGNRVTGEKKEGREDRENCIVTKGREGMGKDGDTWKWNRD